MKKLAEGAALVQLRRTKQHFASYINQHYTAKAKDCRTCQTVCCADDHFVNVNITRLEALAIWRTLHNSPRISPQLRQQLLQRAAATVLKYRLSNTGDTFQQTYSCPLFEPGIGCVVHWKAKPAPCIQHGCYEDWQDLPDMTQFQRVERRVERLNTQVYPHQAVEYAPIPVWLMRIAEELGDSDPDAMAAATETIPRLTTAALTSTNLATTALASTTFATADLSLVNDQNNGALITTTPSDLATGVPATDQTVVAGRPPDLDTITSARLDCPLITD
jgi:hypothetical protein